MTGITKIKIDEQTNEISTYELSWKDFFESKEIAQVEFEKFKEKYIEDFENE